MTRGSAGALGFTLLVAVLAACGPSDAEVSSSSVPGLPSPAAGGLLPAGCHPLVFRDPDGDALDLTGRWISGSAEEGPPEVPPWGQWSGTWIRQAGDCLWGVDFSDPPEPGFGPDLWSWTATMNGSLDLAVTTIYLTENDPTDIAHALFGRIGFDQTGEAVICWWANADATGDCPQGPGSDYAISYRVDEPPNPS